MTSSDSPLPPRLHRHRRPLQLLVFTSCYLALLLREVHAIRPSLTPGAKVARQLFQKRRPAFRHFFRNVGDEQQQINNNNSNNNEYNADITKSGSMPALDQLEYVDNTNSRGNSRSNYRREELTRELSTLIKGIETLAEQVEETQSIPPGPIAPVEKEDATTATAGKKKKYNKQTIRTVQELRKAVLDDNKALKDVQLSPDGETQLLVNATTEQLLNHEVIELIAHRFKTGSTPGNRAPDDDAHLAMAIEGGGMRGAVSAGMASAIACLGLCDCFDSIYGSSAGSVIGAYMVSRQMCMDVYVDILPAAKRSFVCTKRLMSSLAITAVDLFLQGVRRRRRNRLSRSTENDEDNLLEDEVDDDDPALKLPKLSRFRSATATSPTRTPGMNISFVLDGIMDPEHGIRPIDMETFRRNNAKQPLYVASSYAKNGKLYTKCFSTPHFFGTDKTPATSRKDGKRRGLFACLEPSMTVPGATGPPVQLYNTEHQDSIGTSSNATLPFFDAFCFEPLPYRSAVENGATHVMVLCSRPEGFEPKTKPGVYETAIAPLYFKSHGEPQVGEFFARGGQQYIYLEDILTLEEGKVAGMNRTSSSAKQEPIAVPPAKILYGVDCEDNVTHTYVTQRDELWNKAHLLPLKVPIGTPELATLEQGKEAVREAVQGGFAAAFDLLAPAIGLNTHGDMTGMEVAKLVFPEQAGLLDEVILQEQKRILGDEIIHYHNAEEEEEDVSSDQPQEEDEAASPSGLRREKRRKRDIFIKNARRVLRAVRRRKQEQQEEKDASSPSLTDEEAALEQKAKAFESSVVASNLITPKQQQQLLASLDSIAFTAGSDKQNAEQLLRTLPGFQSGRLSQLTLGLRDVASDDGDDDDDSQDTDDFARRQTLKA